METKGLRAWKGKGRKGKMRHAVDARRAHAEPLSKIKRSGTEFFWTPKNYGFVNTVVCKTPNYLHPNTFFLSDTWVF